MENASKALLMAAGVLIGVIIMSLAVYLFVSFGSDSAQINKQIEEQQIEQFNSQFTSYEGKECTIYDVITLANLASDNNNYYEYKRRNKNNSKLGKDNYIIVITATSGNIENKSTNFYNRLINKSLTYVGEGNELQKYKIEVYISQTTQRVYKINCTPVNNL